MANFEQSLLGKIRKVWGKSSLIFPGATVVLEESPGRVLMVRRAHDGRWQVPAGYMEEGESLEQTAVRECREEIGVTPLGLVCYGIVSAPPTAILTYANGDVVHSIGVCFTASGWDGDIRIRDGENLELRFISMDALPEDASPGSRKILAMLRDYRATGLFQMF